MVAAPQTFEGWFTLKFCLSSGSMDSLADKLLQCLGAKERAMVGSLSENCEPTASSTASLGSGPIDWKPLMASIVFRNFCLYPKWNHP
jgi:hypothetical protein